MRAGIHRRLPVAACAAAAFIVPGAGAGEQRNGSPPARDYPDGVREVRIPSTADGSLQPALFRAPEGDEPVPLLVALHTWSGNYRQKGGEVVYAEWCLARGWAFLHPDFRGPNRTPEAMGSDLVIADIASAVEWARARRPIAPDRIYAVGVSGGGHAAMLVAARLPDIWAGVSAWCGISDIATWHRETSAAGRVRYARDIEGALGGAPNASEALESEARKRSPVAWLGRERDFPLDLWHGIDDGRTGSVPFTHAFEAWNAAVSEEHRFSGERIEAFYQTRRIPEAWSRFRVEAPGEAGREPLLRRTAATTRITIFAGGHEIDHARALSWLAAQRRGRAPVWDVPVDREFTVSREDGESGK